MVTCSSCAPSPSTTGRELRTLLKVTYIITGGYSAEVQDGGRWLAENRQDCICLADVGANNSSASADMAARLNDCPWNTWNAMLYTQWRQRFDEYTGEKIWVSPVFHAVERHLFVD